MLKTHCAGYLSIQIYELCPVIQNCKQSCLLFLYESTQVATPPQWLYASRKKSATAAAIITAKQVT